MPYGVFSFQCLNWGYSSLFPEMLCFQLRAFAHPLPSPSAVDTNFVSYDVTVNCRWTCALSKANCCSQPIHTCVLMPSDIVHRAPPRPCCSKVKNSHPFILCLLCWDVCKARWQDRRNPVLWLFCVPAVMETICSLPYLILLVLIAFCFGDNHAL